ncbi:hypothetical protein K2173_003838 [Erythroxylum novogranatense]|uniref:Uncharacterized protein n=1 Tax=Erythroxylum novogranatense TaxID=1862640 RepID=A0AAV8S3Q3_9ROSI|nr:hypothetical protein K2173_003838 [Erythroxylum novogranatense]
MKKSRIYRNIPNHKDRDDHDHDLLLFKELNKREKDRLATLLHPLSDDLEPNPVNNALYRIASGRKPSGYEFFGENDNKNDYNWLKTPPATPLFPSLEMEAAAIASELVVQRQLPILQPVSGLTGKLVGLNGRSKSPISSGSNQRFMSNMSSNHINNTKISPSLSKQKNRKEIQTTSPILCLSKDTGTGIAQQELIRSNRPKSTSRGLSPSPLTMRSKIAGFPDDTPSNLLRTNRAASATRGRPSSNNFDQKAVLPERVRSSSRRQSCSPNVTRGRKESTNNSEEVVKVRICNYNQNVHQFLGSRMVERVMNARKSSAAEDRAAKTKSSAAATTTTGTGFGNKMMSKSALDMPIKHVNLIELSIVGGAEEIKRRQDDGNANLNDLEAHIIASLDTPSTTVSLSLYVPLPRSPSPSIFNSLSTLFHPLPSCAVSLSHHLFILTPYCIRSCFLSASLASARGGLSPPPSLLRDLKRWIRT